MKVTNISQQKLSIILSPKCFNCNYFEPDVRDSREWVSFWNIGQPEERERIGECAFSCEHYAVCKKRIDNPTVLKIMEASKNDISEEDTKDQAGTRKSTLA